jgi:Na+-translocating ferredoxin:NAD+ oxidoreductase RnfG subunit
MRPIPALILLMPGLAIPAFGAEYLAIPQAQAALFREADQFIAAPIALTDEQQDAIKKLSGQRQRTKQQAAWRAMRGSELLGWFIVDDVVGKHEFITYAAAITPDGHVRGIEILVYRETYGFQIAEAQWRDRFRNKTLQDAFKLDQDIPNITGATLSCRNVTNGVKRLLALHRVVLANG